MELKLLVLALYVAAMLYLGYVGMRRTKTVGDFFLGGRAIGPWMSAFAYGTTYFSAVLFVGYAGKLGWGFGPYTFWIVAGNTIVGSLLAWLVLARRTRSVTEELGAMTMPEFLEARYGSRALRVMSALHHLRLPGPLLRFGLHGPQLPVRGDPGRPLRLRPVHHGRPHRRLPDDGRVLRPDPHRLHAGHRGDSRRHRHGGLPDKPGRGLGPRLGSGSTPSASRASPR